MRVGRNGREGGAEGRKSVGVGETGGRDEGGFSQCHETSAKGVLPLCSARPSLLYCINPIAFHNTEGRAEVKLSRQISLSFLTQDRDHSSRRMSTSVSA